MKMRDLEDFWFSIPGLCFLIGIQILAFVIFVIADHYEHYGRHINHV